MGVDLPLPQADVPLGDWGGMGMKAIMDSEMFAELSHTAFWSWEIAFFLLLASITYYRRELSSNRVYHKYPRPGDEGKGGLNSPPSSPSSSAEGGLTEDDDAHLLPLPLHLLMDCPLPFVDPLKALPIKLLNELQQKLVKVRGLDQLLYHPHFFQDNQQQQVLLNYFKRRHHEEGEGCNTGDAVEEGDRGGGKAKIMNENVATAAGKKDATFLQDMPDDVQLQVMEYLQPQDVLQLTQSSKASKNLCDQDMIWRLMWTERFGCLWANPVVQEILVHRSNGNSTHYRNSNNIPQPKKGWKRFYSEFELSWLDWLTAGYNTEERCLVGIHDAIYDLTSFLERHPGSKETILINAGSDATAFFEDVGHSSQARALMRDYLVAAPRRLSPPSAYRCVVLQSVKDELVEQKRTLEGGPVGSSPFSALHSQTLKELIVGSEEEDEEDEYDDDDYDVGVHRIASCLCSAKGVSRVIYDPVNGQFSCWASCCASFKLVYT